MRRKDRGEGMSMTGLGRAQGASDEKKVRFTQHNYCHDIIWTEKIQRKDTCLVQVT